MPMSVSQKNYLVISWHLGDKFKGKKGTKKHIEDFQWTPNPYKYKPVQTARLSLKRMLMFLKRLLTNIKSTIKVRKRGCEVGDHVCSLSPSFTEGVNQCMKLKRLNMLSDIQNLFSVFFFLSLTFIGV